MRLLTRLIHFPSRRSAQIAILVSVAIVVAGATAAVGLDRRRSDQLLPDTRIGGIDVGGLSVTDATAVLTRALEDPLHRDITVRGPGLDVRTTPWKLGMRIDVASAVEQAAEQAREGHLVRRVWRHLAGGGDREVALAPTLDRSVLESFVEDAADRVRITAVDATMKTSDGWLRFTPSKSGRELDVEAAAESLREAVAGTGTEVSLSTRVVEPKVPASAFATAILVRAGENKLYLYRNGVVAKTYDVATGSPQHATPLGRYEIVRKRKNPTWVNPGSDWAKKMPASIRPGPDNPLGSRALDINAPGIRIHGTPDARSIGFSVSHGCVRMHMADAED
ncbi:MAG TPA: L,D-transpeptidase/peptidoglycan binding protein, partial [Actinomycetota bacterium]|nr:L,D-transpeptidase/peptidoglycan binding protein [Actinomycetota bacterium]